jgi:hypothetical protein
VKKGIRSFLFNLPAVVLGIFLALIGLYLLDLTGSKSMSERAKNVFFSKSKKNIANIPNDIFINTPYTGMKNRQQFFKSFDEDTYQSTKVVHKDERINIDIQLSQKKDGRVLRDIRYTTDKFWRRQTFSQKSQVAVIYLGCSFVFGENLNDSQTMPQLAQELIPQVSHINLGLPSLGVNDIYAQIFQPDFKVSYIFDKLDSRKRYLDLPVKKIILVYYFIADHLFRSQCSQRCFYEDERLVLEKPYYEFDQKMDLIYKGSNGKNISPWLKILSKSKTLKSYHIDVPDPFSELNIQKHHLFLKKIKEAYEQKYDVMGSYVFYNPIENHSLIEKIEDSPNDKEFKKIILDRNFLTEKYGIENLVLPYDGHPSEFLNKISAKALAWVLRRDFPELFSRAQKSN